MSKSVMAILIAVVAGLAIIVFLIAGRPDTANQTTPTPEATPPASQQDTEDDELNSREAAPSSDQSAGANVEIVNFEFTPSTITVKKGTTVTWTNKDQDEHTVTPDQESADFQGSGMLDQGETYSFTFMKAGTYTYHCQPHPQMQGRVVVTE